MPRNVLITGVCVAVIMISAQAAVQSRPNLSPAPRHFFQTTDHHQLTSFRVVQAGCTAWDIGHSLLFSHPSFSIVHPMDLIKLRMTFADNGHLIHAVVSRSSGDQAVDQKVLRKVEDLKYEPLLPHAPPVKTITIEVSMAEALLAQTGPSLLKIQGTNSNDNHTSSSESSMKK